MQTQEYDGSEERRVLISHIVDDQVCAAAAAAWTTDGLYDNRYANLLGAWSCSYHAKHGRAPRNDIQRRYQEWLEGRHDKATAELVESLLRQLAADYDPDEPRNSAYLVDLAIKHFRRVRLSRHAHDLAAAVEGGDIERAESLASSWATFDLQTSPRIDPLRDHDAIRAAFDDTVEPLVRLPGAYGEFVNPMLERGILMTFESPTGRGKSQFLLDFAFRAMLQRLKVAYFILGDLSQNQIMRRFGQRSSQRPRFATSPHKPVMWPKSIIAPFGADPVVEWDTRTYSDNLRWTEVVAANDALIRNRLKTNESLLYLSIHPANSINIRQVADEIRKWDRGGWGAPDCVVLDYADVLAPIDPHQDKRDQIDATWMAMRALADQYHCIVVTAIQTNTASFDTHTLDLKHFGGANLKLFHSALVVGINQTKEEKSMNVFRINVPKAREMEFDQRKCVYLAACTPLMNPCVVSCFGSAPPQAVSADAQQSDD
jgi:hypothetical protein